VLDRPSRMIITFSPQTSICCGRFFTCDDHWTGYQ